MVAALGLCVWVGVQWSSGLGWGRWLWRIPSWRPPRSGRRLVWSVLGAGRPGMVKGAGWVGLAVGWRRSPHVGDVLGLVRGRRYLGVVGGDTWAGLAGQFVDEAYASVKGYVRTYVMHHQLMEHLPAPPAAVLDVGGGAGHQSFPLALAGFEVTVLDSSPAMLGRARERLQLLPEEARRRVAFVEAAGEDAAAAVGGRRFDAVLCHGVLGYLERPEPLVDQLCQCVAPGGLVSIMTGNARAAAVRPAMERRWEDALASFDARTEVGVLGVSGRADTVEEIGGLLRLGGVEPVRWYGVWLFVDWLEFGGAELDPTDTQEVAATAAVELEAARRDPYRQLSRVFHLVGRHG